MIVGHGIDLVEIARIQKLLDFGGDDFLFGAFTRAERDLSREESNVVQFLAGRLAAKEAVAKALGTGFSGSVSWQHVTILRRSGGMPTVALAKAALAEANRLGVDGWFLSISHSDTSAIASAIALSAGGCGGGMPVSN
jgi:holo-[acyl-carrier protein] synthase